MDFLPLLCHCLLLTCPSNRTSIFYFEKVASAIFNTLRSILSYQQQGDLKVPLSLIFFFKATYALHRKQLNKKQIEYITTVHSPQVFIWFNLQGLRRRDQLSFATYIGKRLHALLLPYRFYAYLECFLCKKKCGFKKSLLSGYLNFVS